MKQTCYKGVAGSGKRENSTSKRGGGSFSLALVFLFLDDVVHFDFPLMNKAGSSKEVIVQKSIIISIIGIQETIFMAFALQSILVSNSSMLVFHMDWETHSAMYHVVF